MLPQSELSAGLPSMFVKGVKGCATLANRMLLLRALLPCHRLEPCLL